MKNKKIYLTIVLIFLSVNAFCADFFWDFGTAFIGGKLGYDGSGGPVFEADIQVLDLRLETDIGFLFAFSPFNTWAVLNRPQEPYINLTTFANFTLGYDIFRFRKDFEIIPYISGYGVAIEGLKRFRVDIGVLFNMYADLIWPKEILAAAENYHLRGELFAGKLGIRLNQGQPQVYADLGVNLFGLGFVLFGK
ncbi:MAG: hypothetical protein IK102_09370 [Treponema sp.]|nr:hypothetical protein [Treponema sp.]